MKAARAHADSNAGKGYAERTGAAREDEELHSRKQPALSDDDGYRGSYNPRTHTVTLTRDADVTTVVHEMSHAYLERLMEMYAAGKLPRLLAADAKAILDHFGITADDWAGMSTAQKRKIHEWFAYNSEIYLGRGKAPTLRLTRLFHRFATWVQQVYKDGGNVQKVLGIMFKDEFGEDLDVLPKAARQTLAHMYGDSALSGRKSWGTNVVTEKNTEPAEEFRQGWVNGRFADAKKRIARIVQRVRDGLSTNAHGRDSFEDYLPVSEETAERIGRLGFDVHGYVHSLTDASVAHALGRHGNQMEERENQIPLTDSDFLRLPEVVNRPDEIEYAGRSGNSGNNVLRFKKTFPDGTNIFVEEIRNGRKKLMLLTAYKKVPTALDARPPKRNPPLKRPKRSASDLPEDTIAEFPDGELEDSGDEFHSRKPKVSTRRQLAER